MTKSMGIQKSMTQTTIDCYLKTKSCCFCKNPYGKYGNSPSPVQDIGRCCDSCNISVVMRIRLGLVMGALDNNDDDDDYDGYYTADEVEAPSIENGYYTADDHFFECVNCYTMGMEGKYEGCTGLTTQDGGMCSFCKRV